MLLTGYQSEQYSQTFENLGKLKFLHTGYNGLCLQRQIPGTDYTDICSLYPVYAATHYKFIDVSSLRQFNKLKDEGIVSITLISDPLDNKVKDYLFFQSHDTETFYVPNMGFDTIKPYKKHYIIKLQEPWVIHNNHYRNIKKAVRNEVKVNNVTLHWTIVNEIAHKFYGLYSVLTERHDIIGISNFNFEQIISQLKVPGSILLEATKDNQTIGYILFYLEWPNVRYHLACYNKQGYENSASFLLMYEAMHFFKQLGCNMIVLGAGAGTVTASEGLDRFKSGWTNYTKQNYILFKNLNPNIYNKLSEGKSGDYLPLYRSNA